MMLSGVKLGPAWVLRASVALALSSAATTALHAQQPAEAARGAPPASSREQELQERVEQLEQRVNELESSTVLSEPQTIVKEIQVYVDENGVEYDEPGPGRRPVSTYQRERVYRRQAISEKLDEALEDAASRSVAVGVDAAIVLQNVQQTSGEKRRPTTSSTSSRQQTSSSRRVLRRTRSSTPISWA